MKYGIFSANEFLYTDSKISDGGKQIKLFAAQNSFANAQILLSAKGDIKFEWCADSASAIPCPEIYKLLPVYVDKNTGSSTTDSVVPNGTVIDYSPKLAPFNVYDAMEPMNEAIIGDESDTVAVYLRWPTVNLNKGIYSGTLKLTDANGDTCRIDAEINVTNARIPENETLRVTNWFNMNSVYKHHNVEPWSEEYWRLIEEYGKLMREAHQTDFWLQKTLFTYKKDGNGNYVFDFSKAERLIKLYLSLGFKYIEGPIMLYRKSWEQAEFYIKIDGEDVHALSNEAYPFMMAFYTQLYSFLKNNGWFEIFYAHVGDEPQKYCVNEYRIISGLIRKWMPGVKIIEAVETPELDGAVDIWVPKSDRYLTYKQEFDLKMARGEDEFWFYTCMFPGGHYLNRLLDEELIRTRYLHWANFVYGFTGYLHWGLNMYDSNNGGNSVFTGACSRPDGMRAQLLPAGDTHIVYPLGKQVLRSARLEMMRAGCEDYELIKLVEAKDKAKIDEIVNKCVRTFTDYTKDIDAFEAAYRELLEQF